MPRRRYDQFCAVARALDRVGDRWTLLIVRELSAGPRRYTDLHADLPGISTDVLASRLKDMEADELATRRRLPAPASATVYSLTPRGRGLLPVLTALAEWGAPDLAERRPTDAVRPHWFAIPLARRLREAAATAAGAVTVTTDEGGFRVTWEADTDPVATGAAAYGTEAAGTAPHPAAEGEPEVVLTAATCVALTGAGLDWEVGVKEGRIEVRGEGPLADALRGGAPHA
ncbi:winged helix-turn-helix transcriptional regulator [Streptomyces sp. NPDC059740]|uniref:winged helix-turn-helix transcriptional regulator n=1 Tax=Streptomyces sp. NPDC059740 TaxID=3346926 RepID=UPI0036525C55